MASINTLVEDVYNLLELGTEEDLTEKANEFGRRLAALIVEILDTGMKKLIVSLEITPPSSRRRSSLNSVMYSGIFVVSLTIMASP